MNNAIYLDRDGTLNQDDGYVHKIKNFQLLPDVLDALKLLKNDFKLFIITNQSGIGRGYFGIEDVKKFNNHMIKEFKKEGIKIEEVYICPHNPDKKCDCRKPNIKFIKETEREFNIDLKSSWVIGDLYTDIKMGKNSGCKTIYVLTGHGKDRKNQLEENGIIPDFICENILEAAKTIIQNKNLN